MNAQERFLNRFDPDGDGFIYRSAPGGPGVFVTAEERAEMVALDDDRGGIATILYVITLPLAAAVGAGLSANPVTSPWAQAVSASIFFGLPVSALVWVSMAPDRILRGCPNVDNGLSKDEAERRSIRERSWFVLIVTGAGSVAAGFNLARWTEAYMALRLLGAFCALSSIAIFARQAEVKVRMLVQDHRARTGKP